MSTILFRKRAVWGYWFKGDGTPLQGETILFNLTDDLGYTERHVVGNRPIAATVQSDGKWSAELWCDEDSNAPLNWRVQFPKEPNNTAALLPKTRDFSLAFGDGTPMYIGTLLTLSVTPPSDTILLYQAVYAYIQSLIEAGVIVGPSGGTGNTYFARISCGGGAASPFAADSHYSGGNSYAYAPQTVTSPTAAPAIVYQSIRYGVFTYTFGAADGLVAGGSYIVRIHGASESNAPGNSFNFTINGAAKSLTPYVEAGGANKAFDKDYAVTADGSGNITITTVSGGSTPFFCGIEIIG